MKRLSLVLAMLAFPLAAIAAEPGAIAVSPEVGQWVWCQADAQGQTGAGAPERAELSINGTSLSGRLLVNDKPYGHLQGVIRLASSNTDADGATMRVWEITATEIAGVGAASQKVVLKGSYTKYQSRDPQRRSYEVLALSVPGSGGAPMIISRLQNGSPLRFASR